jgi:hypothetical protein
MRGRVVLVACCIISAINPTNHATTNHTVGISRNKKIFRKDYLYCSLFGVRGRLGVIQWTWNAVLFQAIDQHNDEASSLSKPSLAAQIATLERQL